MTAAERVADMTEIEAKEALLWLLHKAAPLGVGCYEAWHCRITCEDCLLDQAKEDEL